MNIAVLAANKKQNKSKFDFTSLLLVVSVLFIITRLFLWGTYKVNGHSMDPTLRPNNYLVTLINEKQLEEFLKWLPIDFEVEERLS